jgi:hypothetical protein
VATTTVAVPPALATGSSAAFWNPAQDLLPGRSTAALEIIQAPNEIGVAGLLSAVHIGIASMGHIGLLYGRMQVTDLVRTTASPEPQPGSVPYYTHAFALTWTRPLAATAVGLTLGFHQNHFDLDERHRWTFDAGLQHSFGDVLRVAAATHLLSPEGGPAGRDVYAGLGYRVWHGDSGQDGGRTQLELRYGMTVARGFEADHMLGVGLDIGAVFGFDLMLGREGGYADAGWRPAGAIRLHVGRYKVTVARDAGNAGAREGIGSAFRVGLEAQLN